MVIRVYIFCDFLGVFGKGLYLSSKENLNSLSDWLIFRVIYLSLRSETDETAP